MAKAEMSISSNVELVKEPPSKKEYLYPYWSNKENRHLIVTIRQPNGKESIASIQDTDGTNPDMKAVLEQYTEAEIDENTQKSLDRRNENIKRQMERRESQAARAKQEGLFTAKLQAFEIDAIKNSKNVQLKRAIRKSKSIMEVQAYATILLMKEIENGEEAN
jgi:actin-related protein